MLRAGVIKQIHPGHIGVERSLRRAREVICWPGMNAEVNDHVSKSDVCNAHKPEQCREKLQTHAFPHPPAMGQLVATDLFELDGHRYIILVDYYSNFFEINEQSWWLNVNTITQCHAGLVSPYRAVSLARLITVLHRGGRGSHLSAQQTTTEVNQRTGAHC